MQDTKTATGFTPIDNAVIDRMERLVRRYPTIDPNEMTQLLHFLRHGAIMDRGMLSSRDGMKERIESIQSEHRGTFALGPRDYLVFTILTVALVAVGWWLSGIAG